MSNKKYLAAAAKTVDGRSGTQNSTAALKVRGANYKPAKNKVLYEALFTGDS